MKYNRQFARRQWRKSFGAGMFKRRQKRRVNHFGRVWQLSAWAEYQKSLSSAA
jgi:hypothetical protein